jgi:hypothetical protein
MKKELMKPPFTHPLTAKELAALPDEDIDFLDVPETTDEWFARAKIMRPQNNPMRK